MIVKIMSKLMFVGVFLLLVSCTGFKTGNGSSGQNYQAMAKQSLDQLISAYEAKNIRQFSDLVSDRYTGDKRALDTSVLLDFSSYQNVSLRYTFNNVTFDGNNKVSAAITFTKEWTDVKTSKTFNETKESSMIFVLEGNILRLYSQKPPLLFGLK